MNETPVNGAASRRTPLMDGLITRTVRMRRPLSVHFDLTYRCNERCIHCYLDHEDHGELTTAEVERVLEELAASGTLFLTFSGGEIFLRCDLEQILETARRLHFDISLKTNALLLTRQRARRLRELGVRRVQISIYSDDATVHDAITKIPGSLQRSLATIPALLEEGLVVKIACPLMTGNLASYSAVRALAERLGVPYMFDLTITPMMDGGTTPLALRAGAEQLLPIMQHAQACGLASAEQRGRPDDLGSSTSSGIESSDGCSAYDDIPCSAGHNSCYISPYGDVYPCVQMPIAAGNLRRESFRDVWEGSQVMRRVRAIRESELRVCSGCSIRQYCERCPGLARTEGGDLEGPYERACELAEARARLAGVSSPVSALHRLQRTQQSATPPLARPDLVASLPYSEKINGTNA